MTSSSTTADPTTARSNGMNSTARRSMKSSPISNAQCRRIVVVAAGAHKAQVVGSRPVLLQDRGDDPRDVGFRKRIARQAELALEAELGRDLLVDLLDRADSDLREHLLADPG